jgi:hypothetical protein
VSSHAGARRRYGAALAAVLVLLTVAGCGEDSEDPTDTPTRTEDGLTVGGTTLHVGDTATVPRTNGTGTIELTVTDIVEGSSQDLATTGLKDADQKTPYYVSYEMKVVSGDVYGMTMRHYLSAWADGQQVGELVPFDRFPTCQEVNFPVDTALGTTISSCLPYVTDKGAPPVDTVRFDNDDTYEIGDGTAVGWE